MNNVISVERVFCRQAGPRRMYGAVKLRGQLMEDFVVKFLIQWPQSFEQARYEAAIRTGITAALREAGHQHFFGHFQVVGVKFSNDDEANVPFAYGEAARLATLDIVDKWKV